MWFANFRVNQPCFQTGFLRGVLTLSLEAQKPTQNPEIPKKRKVRANFSLPSCDVSQERSRNCSEKLAQMNFITLAGFYLVEFASMILSGNFGPIKNI